MSVLWLDSFPPCAPSLSGCCADLTGLFPPHVAGLQLCNVGAWTVMASAATRMGILEVAAHQLMLSLWLVIAFVQGGTENRLELCLTASLRYTQALGFSPGLSVGSLVVEGGEIFWWCSDGTCMVLSTSEPSSKRCGACNRRRIFRSACCGGQPA